MQTGICSFSEVYNHELMWAHYANQFNGICIAYDFYKLLKYLPNDAKFVRMFYSEVLPSVGLTKRQPEELARMVLSYKNHRWQYEREWRLLANQGNISYQDHSCVTLVYIGSRVNAVQQRRIEARLRALEISYRAMQIDGYSMTFGKRS
jgi:hypothetical protein